MRLFLEKIRPIDKKLQYQIQKLTRDSDTTSEKSVISEKGTDTQKEDLLKYRPNPDMLVGKSTGTPEKWLNVFLNYRMGANVYRPLKLAPALMDDDKMSKQKRNDLRREKEILQSAKQSPYIIDLLNDLEGRPEEVREFFGTESRELTKYMAKMEERAKEEEELFARAPLTKLQKKTMKHLKKSRNGDTTSEKSVISEKGTDTQKEDLLKYRPNPDMLVGKSTGTPEDGANVYRPPKLAPALMDDDKMSKQKRNDLRREKEILQSAKQSPYIIDLLNDLEGRPEEVREFFGTESRELTKYMAKMEERAKEEEESFARAPLTKLQKKTMKHLKKSRNGLLGLTDSFYDEIKSLPVGEPVSEENFENDSAGIKQKKRKRRH